MYPKAVSDITHLRDMAARNPAQGYLLANNP
jgi:hypothetical protein